MDRCRTFIFRSLKQSIKPFVPHLLACLIVAPRWGYDEPKILSYAISPFFPTSADGLQRGYRQPQCWIWEGCSRDRKWTKVDEVRQPPGIRRVLDAMRQ